MKISFPANSVKIELRTGVSEILGKIQSFRELTKGWAYGRGSQIPTETVERALNLHAFFGFLNFKETDAFPGEFGEIELAVYRGQSALYFLIKGEKYSIKIETDESETIVGEGVSDGDAYKFAVQAAQDTIGCDTSGSRARDTTSRKRNDLEGLPSQTQVIVQPPLFSASASTVQGSVSADTSVVSILATSQASLPFSQYTTSLSSRSATA